MNETKVYHMIMSEAIKFLLQKHRMINTQSSLRNFLNAIVASEIGELILNSSQTSSITCGIYIDKV
ncbi:hypothetical protein RHGRI_020150 [Rhododendron griersonianum]|uniref:Uncharacterized protein n=2 Tax=Rhododendron griersonianum TaxID=479676 RepID=A0AAV6JFG3_9ERIC|nr:hypothetical protein RHGRI_020150 [Rhododendron griersonianum]